MENQNNIQSVVSLQRLNAVVGELIATVQNQKSVYQQELETKSNKINGLQTEIQNLNNALNNRKAQIEDLENKNRLLTAQLAELQAKIDNAADNGEETSRLQTLLEEEKIKSSEFEEKYHRAEETLKQNQQEIAETSQQIDGVIARLERVLQENGAGNNSN